MNLFLAAIYADGYKPGQASYAKLNEHEQSILRRIPNHLESYHYVGKQKFVDVMRQDGAQIFLDSGAFSAFSLGVSIDINAYCDYVKKNGDILRKDDGVIMASVLDGIGDPLKTWQNQLYMESQGAIPLPCFHFGEDERYLEWYIARYKYITIGGLVGKQVDQVIIWLDRIWNKYLLDGSGRPRLKVHAFGVTTNRIMERYPWYSVDSSSWIQYAIFGWIYNYEHGAVTISSKSPTRHDIGRHYSTLTTIEQDALKIKLNRKGFDPERLAEVYESRAAYNCLGYMELNEILDIHFVEAKGVLDCHKKQELF